ncbi:uncharacterized protein LOC135841085 [Planococcus citri]|uniref:uncharacterized protein LOC135841085 n=1 Tax=Planococcus citri TaxID=170843 RepID=UPI0031F930A0
MKTTIVSLLFSLCVVQIQSDANYDHFVMSEAHILERRVHEDANAGYLPFYIECPKIETRSNCSPVIPYLSNSDGYVITKKNHLENHIFYGCIKKKVPSNELNPVHYKNTLTMKRARATVHQELSNFRPFYNLYKLRCRSEVSPTIWKTARQSNLYTGLEHYEIGFMIEGLYDMPLAEVHFDHDKKIPLYTKHTLYGKSLTAQTEAFKTKEELVYEEDSTRFTVEDLQAAIEYYYKFNEVGSATRSDLYDLLSEKGLNTIPEKSEISLAHLIPEYDTIETSWKNIARFAQTIAPMWTDLYINEWADIENKIREVAFMKDKKLTVISGTHGQLTFNFKASEKLPDENKFFLNYRSVCPKLLVPVPELFWKLVIDDTVTYLTRKSAIVIIMYNVTEVLTSLNIFAPFQKPCESKCNQLQWSGIEKPNLVYCCNVREVKRIITEFPTDIHSGHFDPFSL